MKNKLILLFVSAMALAACSKGGFYPNAAEAKYDAAVVSEPGMQDEGMNGDSFDEIIENEFVKTAEEPVSTFSIDADGASYAYMRRCITLGFLPNKNSVRTEEFLNYFTFDYPDPAGKDVLTVNAETGSCPWNPSHKLLRLGLKGKSLSDGDIPQANYVLLVDTSGSMDSEDRIELVKSGLINMLEYMRPDDRIALITYSGNVKKVLSSTPVSNRNKIKRAIRKLSAEGFTAGGAAMKMAYEEAVQNYVEGGNNRIIMCTDGDFNVGVSSTEALVEMVESYLDKGIYLSIMGFGMGNLHDSRMENISNHGNGTYNYIDSEEEMMKVFVNERSRFYSVANDTKCQVTFAPGAVESYRLIGYENRMMANEDFEDDSKDAGEIGAGQTITALYEIIPARGWEDGALTATFDVRYKEALGDQSKFLSIEVPAQDAANSSELDFAASLAAYSMLLRGSQYAGDATYKMVSDLASGSLNFDPGKFRRQYLELVSKASAISPNQQ